jgi:hypothetical protein
MMSRFFISKEPILAGLNRVGKLLIAFSPFLKNKFEFILPWIRQIKQAVPIKIRTKQNGVIRLVKNPAVTNWGWFED